MQQLNMPARILVVVMIAAFFRTAFGDTHYVVTSNSAAADPYTSWETAGTNIIDVVNAAIASSAPRIVWVTNGVYRMTNVVVVTKTLTLQSVNGSDATILDGNAVMYTNGCAYFSSVAASSVFDGFTVSNYYNKADASYNQSILTTYSIFVRNCLFVGNTNVYGANAYGGCIKINGTSINSITNCIFKNNYANTSAGAIYISSSALTDINNCRFEGNQTIHYYGGACDLRGDNITVSNCVVVNNSCSEYGGGLFFSGGTNNRVLNCLVTENVVNCNGVGKRGYGGGIRCTGQATISDCSIIGNTSKNLGGGVWGTNLTVRNCLIARNIATTNVGGGIWMTNSTVESCTIVSNYAAVAGGGMYITGSDSSGTNNIVYFNTAADGANFTNDTVGATGLNYCCVIPAVAGVGNITNNPALLDLDGGSYRLRVNSPCVNAGTNQAWMTGAVDLDGIPRIRYGIVDMGAYEAVLRQGNIYRVR